MDARRTERRSRNVQVVHEDFDNEVAAQANSRSDVKPRSGGRSQHRATPRRKCPWGTPQTPFAAIFRPISASHPFFLNHPFASAFDHQKRLVRGSLQVIRTVTLTETHNRVSAIA